MNHDIISLGTGKLSGACKTEGENVIVVQRNGAFHKLSVKGKKVVDMGVVGYGNDCYVFPEGTVFFEPEVRYEANN